MHLPRLLAALTLGGSLLAAASAAPAHAAAGPVVSVTAAGSYFPVRDGYQDVFAVTIGTNEQATAHLFIVASGGNIVARGVKALDEDIPTTVTAGGGLRPGTYKWFLAVTDLAGNTTTTPTKTLLADGRRLIPSTVSRTLPITALAATLHHGSCSTAVRSGGGVVLTTGLECADSSPAADTASASITFPLTAGASYGKITISTRTSGQDGVFTAYQGTTQQVAGSGPLKSPKGSLTLPGTLVTKAHTLRFAVETSGGEHLTLQAVSVSYVLNTLRSGS